MDDSPVNLKRPQDQPNLARDIFGGSDSELSSDEEDRSRIIHFSLSIVVHILQMPHPDILRPLSLSDSSGESDDYVQRKQAKTKKSSRTRKRDEGERPTQRKRKRKPVPMTEQDLSELPPEQGRSPQIEAILKPKKSFRPKKRKANEEVLDSFADDEVARLREAMNAAADEDIRANAEKRPASAKLILLPVAVETMRKASLAQSMIDNNLLEAVRRWLEPLPDCSLPALNIQREFFTILKKMEFIDSSVLKEAGLGRIVLFYTKCKRVAPFIHKIANELVSMWSRPIIKRSASFRDKVIPVAQQTEDGTTIRVERLNTILARAKESEKGRARTNAVMIPRSELGSYTVAPKSNAAVVRDSVGVDTERRRKNAERLRSLPLAIVLPHPPLNRRRSSLLSSSSSSPRTPRSCGSPSCSSYFTSNNRKSSDSWNSSTHDFAEDLDNEWKPDQTLLLQRTLNALPAHLVTPFNGPIPPSNLLDKIARGVADKKGPGEWPHSLRATRVKLIELCRLRAVEDALLEHQRDIYSDENEEFSYLPAADNHGKKGKGRRRPLYRQSSMDFINAAAVNVKDNDSIGRLSTRLQRTDRILLDPSFHPYSSRTRPRVQAQTQTRHRRSSSPPRPSDVPGLINPSSPSSSTLNTLSSLSSRYLRSASSFTSDSMMSTSSHGEKDITDGSKLLPSSIPSAPDPRVQRVRRSDSFCVSYCSDSGPTAKTAPALQLGFKRAPSYGTLAQEAKSRGGQYAYGSASTEEANHSFYPSSDEEEKARTRSAKKPRTKASKSPSPPPTVPSSPMSPKPTRSSRRIAEGKPLPHLPDGNKADATSQIRPGRRPLQRSSSGLFNQELPHLHIPSSTNDLLTPLASPNGGSRALPAAPVVGNPTSKTLRRVKRFDVDRRPSRRISFGSLVAPVNGDDADAETEEEPRLGSAFQLQF
ncbi:hypothetical protein C8J56DRAFT_1003110 [Mycena floridula]|nr:hypothetical protein C8J56DRAFT_1003110 [Mycena floridula]